MGDVSDCGCDVEWMSGCDLGVLASAHDKVVAWWLLCARVPLHIVVVLLLLD